MLTNWPDTSQVDPLADWPYRSATWLLGRHPRLAQLAARVGVVDVDEQDQELHIGLDQLGEAFAAIPRYNQAWADYETAHRPPEDEDAYDRWQEAGPKARDFASGLARLLPLSSGEVASLRLLAMRSTVRVPFKIGDLGSLDDEGQRLLADWCAAMRAY